MHSTEIKVDGLPTGQYYILASIDPSFKKDGNLISYQFTSVSNISEILHNIPNELFVVDRNTGKPLGGTDVQLWQRTYNEQTRKYSSIKREKYTTNKNGFVQLSQSKSSENASRWLQFNYQNDELFFK